MSVDALPDAENDVEPELSIDEAYALIDRHIAAIQKLRVWIDGVVALREATAARVLGPATTHRLTPTEQRTLRYYASTHMTVSEIAQTMFVSPNTIKTHLKSIYRKLGVSRRHELAEKVRGMCPEPAEPALVVAS